MAVGWLINHISAGCKEEYFELSVEVEVVNIVTDSETVRQSVGSQKKFGIISLNWHRNFGARAIIDDAGQQWLLTNSLLDNYVQFIGVQKSIKLRYVGITN